MTNEQKRDREAAIDSSKKVLTARVNLLKDTTESINKMIDRIVKDDSSSAMYFEWAVNDLQNMLANLGLAELCRTHANLSHHDDVLRSN